MRVSPSQVLRNKEEVEVYGFFIHSKDQSKTIAPQKVLLKPQLVFEYPNGDSYPRDIQVFLPKKKGEGYLKTPRSVYPDSGTWFFYDNADSAIKEFREIVEQVRKNLKEKKEQIQKEIEALTSMLN